MAKRWGAWMGAGVVALMLFGPVGRYLTVMPGGKWLILAAGFLSGFAVGGWWSRMQEGEEAVLRGRLARGEIRLTEYRLLCRELGIGKKKPTSLKNGEEFSATDGT